jgi:hypothetical protein
LRVFGVWTAERARSIGRDEEAITISEANRSGASRISGTKTFLNLSKQFRVSMTIDYFFRRRVQSEIPPAFKGLKSIRIASPCPANWHTMIGDSRVRHCLQCNRNVYNLSEMTKREAEQLILKHEGRICVRFYQRPDGRILTRDCPRGVRAALRQVSRAASAVLSALMSLSFATAQSAPKANSQPQAQNQKSDTGVSLKVVDELNAAVRHAEVAVKNKATGKIERGTTNSSGLLNISGLSGGSYRLTIRLFGFETYSKIIAVQDNSVTALRVKLQEEAHFGGALVSPYLEGPKTESPTIEPPKIELPKIDLGDKGISNLPPLLFQQPSTKPVFRPR